MNPSNKIQFSDSTTARSAFGVGAIDSAFNFTKDQGFEVKDISQFDASCPQYVSCVFCG